MSTRRNGNGRIVVGAKRQADAIAELEDVPHSALEQLERQTTAMLYAIWRVRGINKRIVDVRKDRDNER